MQNNKTFVGPQEEQPWGRKPIKTRVTLLVCCYMAGEKPPLLCMRSSKNPRWPTVGGKRAAPRLNHCSSKKGWMTTALFSDCLKDVELMLKTRNQKGLLFLDNCPAHKGLKRDMWSQNESWNETVLPPDTSFKLQLSDRCSLTTEESWPVCWFTR